MKNINTSIILDTRYKKSEGNYPLKIRIYDPNSQKTKYIPLSKLNLTAIISVSDAVKQVIHDGFKSEQDFEVIRSARNARGEKREIQSVLQAIEAFVYKQANNIFPFSFIELELKVTGDSKSVNQLDQLYEANIRKFRSYNSYNTADNYRLSYRSLMLFTENSRFKDLQRLQDISVQFLEEYERYMIELNGKSETTVSMYLRCLRTIFNQAIREKLISEQYYPFGPSNSGLYTIPKGDKVIKALDSHEIKLMLKGTPKSIHQEKAKDFWFFIFYAQGINIKDIILLKWDHIKDKSIEYRRAKTRYTGKKQSRIIYIVLDEYLTSVIEKYGSKVKQSDYVFQIINQSMSGKQIAYEIKKFTKYINQHIRAYAESLGINKPISTYWARHSFATTIVRNGASVEQVSDAMNHSDISVTQRYLAGFEEFRKQEFKEKYLKL